MLLVEQAGFLFPEKQCAERAQEAETFVPGETRFVPVLFVVQMIFSGNEKYRRR